MKKFVVYMSIFLSITACGSDMAEETISTNRQQTVIPLGWGIPEIFEGIEIPEPYNYPDATIPEQGTFVAPTTTSVPPPAPKKPAPVPEPSPAPPQNPEGVWDRLAQCESGGNWHINTGNGYYGGLQFSLSSWQWVGGTGYPHEHSRETQIQMAERLLERQGWGAWPACSRKLGLR